MIQDATDQQIKAIASLFPLSGKTVLEIGCGKGRVTRDLARYADRVIASDPDTTALEAAQNNLTAENVEFRHAPDGIPDMPQGSVDLVIYTLSLHHVPPGQMQDSLRQAGCLLKPGGVILVLEPADGGTFNEAKSRFGVGSGDEGPLKSAALTAMQNLSGWSLSETHQFLTEFHFTGEADFFASKLPKFDELDSSIQQKIRAFLQQHSGETGIILTSERSLYLLRPQ